MQILPLLLLLFLSLFSFPSEYERPYSLHRSERHPIHRQTSADRVHHGIDYWVGPTFTRDYVPNKRKMRDVSARSHFVDPAGTASGRVGPCE
jgi:hypothetical protein